MNATTQAPGDQRVAVWEWLLACRHCGGGAVIFDEADGRPVGVGFCAEHGHDGGFEARDGGDGVSALALFRQWWDEVAA